MVLNQYYEPSVETTAQLPTRLCERAADAWGQLRAGVIRAHSTIGPAMPEYDEFVELARTLRFDEDRMRFLPDQQLPDVFPTDQVHFFGISRGLASHVVPSRVNGILPAGQILAALDGESETKAFVDTAGCGVVMSPEGSNVVAEDARTHAEAHIDIEQSNFLRETLR